MVFVRVLFFVLLAATLSSAQSSVIVSFSPNAFFPGGPNEADDVMNGAIFGNATGSPVSFGTTNGADADFDSIVLTGVSPDSGMMVMQEFDVTLALTSNNTEAELAIQRGGVGATGVFGATPTLVDPGEQLTIGPITLIPTGGGTSMFQFDGYDTVFVGNTSEGEMADLNGVNFTAVAPNQGGTSFANAVSIPLANTVVFSGVEGGGGTSLNGLQASFSVVPEPNSMAILGLGLGGLAFLRRRR